MRLLTLFARYGTKKYENADVAADDLARRTFPDADRRTVVIDNALAPETVEEYGNQKTLIGGDNNYWEFSGWDKGLQFVGTEIWKYDFVHFVTSAFGELHTGYLDRFSERMLRACMSRPIAVGHIDCSNRPVGFRDYVSQHWIRSSYFFLRPVEVITLQSLVSLRDTKDLFSGDPSQPFRADAPISAEWRNNIIGWLTGDGTGQGVTWHSRFDLTVDTLPYFEKKTEAILNEHLLSIRLRALGCRLADTTWLAGAIGKAGGEIEMPCWRTQLEKRNQDRVVLPELD